jgi:SAM-dependent methyltransferase
MIRSKPLIYSDFNTQWYTHWAAQLRQNEAGRGKFKPRANKFWQNAIMSQALYERGVLQAGKKGLGFGVGKERLPALFASLGTEITATDQDFKSAKAASWDNDQLAHGQKSLNAEGICPEKEFKKHVSYQMVDMKNIPDDLNNHFDFLWSNCALGHLGSIDDSLDFIEKSLLCLKPGGWAVHTTEANILSNKQTLDNTDTVFFRQSDLFKLFAKLSKQGYIVDTLKFNLGSGKDLKFTLSPEWGSDYSKLLFDGFMATQILLIIHKPLNQPSTARRMLEVQKHWLQYKNNLLSMRRFKARNAGLPPRQRSQRKTSVQKCVHCWPF